MPVNGIQLSQPQLINGWNQFISINCKGMADNHEKYGLIMNMEPAQQPFHSAGWQLYLLMNNTVNTNKLDFVLWSKRQHILRNKNPDFCGLGSMSAQTITFDDTSILRANLKRIKASNQNTELVELCRQNPMSTYVSMNHDPKTINQIRFFAHGDKVSETEHRFISLKEFPVGIENQIFGQPSKLLAAGIGDTEIHAPWMSIKPINYNSESGSKTIYEIKFSNKALNELNKSEHTTLGQVLGLDQEGIFPNILLTKNTNVENSIQTLIKKVDDGYIREQVPATLVNHGNSSLQVLAKHTANYSDSIIITPGRNIKNHGTKSPVKIELATVFAFIKAIKDSSLPQLKTFLLYCCMPNYSDETVSELTQYKEKIWTKIDPESELDEDKSIVQSAREAGIPEEDLKCIHIFEPKVEKYLPKNLYHNLKNTDSDTTNAESPLSFSNKPAQYICNLDGKLIENSPENIQSLLS